MRPGIPNSSAKKPAIKLNRVFVIIPADLGDRLAFDTDKQFVEVDGIPVIERTLNAFKKFSNDLARVGTALRAVVVTNDAYVYKINGMCRYKKYDFVQNVVSGGSTRMESVWKGIEALSELPFPPTDNDVVLIHDGSRCLVDEDTLERCIASAVTYEIVAAAIPKSLALKSDNIEIAAPAPVAEPETPAPAPVAVPTPAPAPVEEKKSVLGLDFSKFPSLAQRLGKTIETPSTTAPAATTAPATPAAPAAPAPATPKAEEKLPEIPSINSKPIFKPAPAPTRPAASAAAATRPAATTTVKPAANPLNKNPLNSSADSDSEMDVQSPQLFRYNKLLKVYVNGIKRNLDVDSDTTLAEALNFKVHYVDGSPNNIKVVTQQDVKLAEKILKNLEAQQTES